MQKKLAWFAKQAQSMQNKDDLFPFLCEKKVNIKNYKIFAKYQQKKTHIFQIYDKNKWF
jgi:hypothetical protein